MNETVREQDQGPDESRPEDEVGGPASEQPTILEFENKLFTLTSEAHFRLSDDSVGEPVLVLNLGGNEVVLPFPGIVREFEIEEGSLDGRMLKMVAEGLKYVKVLKAGDLIPTEVLTGKPSWEISERHRELAYKRLNIQLVNWLGGDYNLGVDQDQLLHVAEDPTVKSRINEAIQEAADHLGLGAGGKDEVLRLIENLAEDLAGIEALRDRARYIVSMQDKVIRLRRAYDTESSIVEIADQVVRLAGIAVKEIQDQFELVDAQTGKIISLLKNVDSQTLFIRKMRNDLHSCLLIWDDIIEAWQETPATPTEFAPDLLRKTYRFLARRYMQEDTWVLSSQLQNTKTGSRQMVW